MIELKEEDLRKAYQEGCNDVKKTLINLYPNFKFEKECKYEKLVDIDETSALYCNGKPLRYVSVLYKLATEEIPKGHGLFLCNSNWELIKRGSCMILVKKRI